jgi:uncharacterized protein
MNAEAAREFSIPTSQGELPALLQRPDEARWLYLLAHGAGAGMRHRFMNDIAQRFASRGIATLRYEFPYMTAGGRRPDPAARLEACVRDVAGYAAREFGDLRLATGGKSMGGRITSQAQAATPLERVERIVFLGFPLHPAGRPATTRGEHLQAVKVPMLFLQGTRDALADLTLLQPICTALGTRATLHVIDGADHGFAVLKRSGRTDDEVLDEIADTTVAWLDAS